MVFNEYFLTLNKINVHNTAHKTFMSYECMTVFSLTAHRYLFILKNSEKSTNAASLNILCSKRSFLTRNKLHMNTLLS